MRVRHACDATGRLLLLVRDGSTLSSALRPHRGCDDVPVALEIVDAPPPNAPSRGRLTIYGWVRPVRTRERRRAAIAFAAANPTSSLLDVGSGCQLYETDLAEARLCRGRREFTIDAVSFAAATADPFHADEAELLADLIDHHPDVLVALRGRACRLVPEATSALPVRMDRYGVMLDVRTAESTQYVRVGFSQPVQDVAELAQVIHRLTCPHCPDAA